MHALSLPSLERVAPRMHASFGGQSTARLALDLLEAGILHDGAAPRVTTSEIIQRAMSTWQGEHLGNLQVLPRVALHIYDEFVDGSPGLWIHSHIVEGRGIPRLTLHERCEKLQREADGLGTLALHCIEKAQRHTAQVATPAYALGMAEYIYWHGELDETMISEELVDMGEDPQANIPLASADFFAAIPEWASRKAHGWSTFKWTAPRRISKDATRVFEACQHVLACVRDRRIKTLTEWDYRRHDGGSDWLEFAAIARWSINDPIPQILDDWYQNAVQGETWDTSGSYELVDDDPKSHRRFQDWLKLWPAWLRLYAAMDALLALVGTPYDD